MQPHSTMLSLPTATKPKRRTVHLEPSKLDKRTRCSPDAVHIRELTVAQGGLGCAIWDGAIVLARWIHLHPSSVRGKVGMELGAGVGVPGIVAARHARRVVLTDYMGEVVSNARYNLALNANVELEDEDDECRDEKELERRRNMRQHVRDAGRAALLDFHSINPDEEDLARMEASRAEDEHMMRELKVERIAGAPSSGADVASSCSASCAADGVPPSSPSSASCCSASDSSLAPLLAPLAERLASLPFVPSEHFVDPTGLGPSSCDFLLGAELIYTPNEHHQTCFLRVLQYYLRPGGRYLCVQSANREGMPAFLDRLAEAGFTVLWQRVHPDSGVLGMYQDKLPKSGTKGGFVQREEDYTLYVIQKGGGSVEDNTSADVIRELSLPGGTPLQDVRDAPAPAVAMLRSAEAVLSLDPLAGLLPVAPPSPPSQAVPAVVVEAAAEAVAVH